jgi:Ser/Thr protein kinase RdoA (MazF antagonist)
VTGHDFSGEVSAGMLDRLASRAIREYGHGDDAEVTLLNVSENATFLVRDPATGRRTVLRVHRRGYHEEAQIASELAWLDALRDEAGLRTPRVVAAPDGRRIVDIEPGPASRHAVMFEWLPGAEPPDHDLVAAFRTLGALTARMHEHSARWRPPSGFDRFAWDYEAAFGSVCRWGRWQDGIGVGPAELAVLGRLDDVLRARLAAFGRDDGRYGLIHADLRLANLLVHGPRHVRHRLRRLRVGLAALRPRRRAQLPRGRPASAGASRRLGRRVPHDPAAVRGGRRPRSPRSS